MKLEGLDHIAISVSDPTASSAWYQEVLGLERRHQDAWGDEPIFLMAGNSGLAIFPNTSRAEAPVRYSRDSSFRHLAFRADRQTFERARRELEARGIETAFEDHRIAQSIYFDDPDGFHLEITTYEV
jgi:catechol 2,3-dioxygenase-like lactoylglutathione lyase family enzyme